MKIPVLNFLTVIAAILEASGVVAMKAGVTLATLTSFGMITSPL